ncbi:MAG: hypothetical protein ACRCTZ_12745, partial [Sarcina sp.]
MFISENFIFNNVSNTSQNVIAVELDTDVLNDIGVVFNRSITREEGFTPTYEVVDGDTEDIVLNLMLIDGNGIDKEWTKEDIKRVKSWLIQDGFKPFVSNDNPEYVYYVQCSSIKNRFTFNKHGVLEVRFKLMDQYAYEKYDKTFIVNGSSNITINNTSNSNHYPIIQITNDGNTSTVNKIGDLEITGLNTNESVIIDNLMLTVESGT